VSRSRIKFSSKLSSSPSLDDKLFSFWFLQADGFPFSHVKGIFRFETGIKVNEFRDLRANPRCLLESQFLSFRVRWSGILTSGIFETPSAEEEPFQTRILQIRLAPTHHPVSLV
jgi:hypothetical protein